MLPAGLLHPTTRQRVLFAAGLFVISIGYMLLTARLQDRDMIPKFHDEHMHLLQARMMAHGKLWTASHPLAEFFDSFHIMVRPVYASIYFPGASLLYLPTAWLNLPHWVMPLLAAAGAVAVFYLIVTELLDGFAALLGALMLVSLQTFRFVAMVSMSHVVMLLFGLLMVWGYLCWRKRPTLLGAALLGGAAGWAAIVRPIDAIAFAIPVAVAVLLDLRTLPRRQALVTMVIAVAVACPFLSLQLVLNTGMTGSPFGLAPQLLRPGFHDANTTGLSELPQKRDMEIEFFQPELAKHRTQSLRRTLLVDRLPVLGEVTLPHLLAGLLIPIGLYELRSNRRWVLGLVPLIYFGLYALFPFWLKQYAVVVAPGMLLLVLAGYQFFTTRWKPAGIVLAIGLACAAIIALPEVNRKVIDDGYLRPTMWFVAKEMPGAVEKPAIVLFRYSSGDNFHEEPVYNVDVVNPDDAPIIRAHDLGVARDRELFDYYAARQPQRNVYLYDRKTRQMVRLGTAAELWQRLGTPKS